MSDPDTDIGGPGHRVPTTRHSVIEAVTSRDPDARRRGFEILIRAYWKPVYKHIRIKWRAANEDAKDLTQAFFARAMEKEFFDRYDARRARFRTFLRTCLDGFVANERKAARRLKRGGGLPHLSLDFAAAEHEVGLARSDAIDPDDFHREWVRSLFALAVEELEARCAESGKTIQFTVFRRYDLDPEGSDTRPTYRQLAAELDLPPTQVTNYLAFARREFRTIVLERLRELCGDDEEFRAEAKELLGVHPT